MLWKRRFFYTSLFAIWLGANLPTIGFAYQQNWFINYIEYWNQTTADCQTQCIIVGKTIETDNARIIKGEVNGQWAIIIGTLINNQFQSQKQFIIQDTQILNETIQLQWDKNSLAAIVVNGSIKRQDLTIQQTYLTIIEKIGNWRKQFRTMDTFKPYTINLLYGPRINGKSALNIFYWLTAIATIIILILDKTKTQKKYYILAIGAVAVLLYDIRMWTEINNYYLHDMKTYIGQEDQIFRDRGDLYQFMDELKQELKKADIKQNTKAQISFYSDLQRPVPWAMKYFLHPYQFTTNEYSQDTQAFIFYGPSAIAQIENNTLNINGQQIDWITIIPIRSWFLTIKS